MRIHRFLLPVFLPTWLILSLSTSIDASTTRCHGHQQLLLLQLKDNLIFNQSISKKLVHWNQSIDDCCQWNGVTCDSGRVVGLDLSEELISGGLNNSGLFNLQYLQDLNLAFNDFNSFVPSKFGKLKNLRRLNLSNAGFEGQIPPEISHLTKLVALDFSTSFTSLNILKLEKPNIATFLQNLTEITQLYLDGIKISAEGKEWGQALTPLRKLQVLSMTSCNLSMPIDSSLAQLPNLSTIRLNLNNISGRMPAFFSNLSNLKVLELSSCELSGPFPSDIFQIQKLETLDLSGNRDLGGTLPNFLQGQSLHTMNLSSTNFSGQLPGVISNLKHLTTLDLSHCQFIGSLPISISKLTQLVHLDLSFNNLTAVIPSSHLEGLVNLRIMNLGHNSLDGKVPSSLFTLPSLQELTLSHNKFEGLLDEFPNTSSSQLHLIDLSGNRFEGHIPVSLFQLKGLQFLQLSENKFNGTVQVELIRNLQKLHTLILSNNNLSIDMTINDDHGLPPFPNVRFLLLSSCNLREFPRFLRSQVHLNSLDLSNNQIGGIIPNWMWRFDSLVYLNLSNNFLTSMEGPLENVSSNIYVLDLRSNQLSGSVPILTKYATHLDFSNNRFNFVPPNLDKYLSPSLFLSLSNNTLRGKIADFFCNFPILRLLDLSHNGFSGSIPKCLAISNSTLRVLNLAGNKLTGYVSDTFSDSCKLRFIDFNGNLLAGNVPKSLTKCQRLEVLNLGNNLFRDEFPCFLGSVSTLRVLILRSNKLHGPIECQHSGGNWDMLHVADLASNSFTGTVPGSLLQRWTKMMGDENKTNENYGGLFFDMYGGPGTLCFEDLSNIMDKGTVKKLHKFLAGVPYSVINHILSYQVSANEYGGHYFDSVAVVYKGSQRELITTLSAYTALDLSSNHFEGPIPQELMSLRALQALNLSHNAFSSHIPLSLGNLTQLETLDLSSNILNGEIPVEISSLHFLSVLNLSFNHLVGEIPTATQIQTFGADSFEGNEGLCGPPLTKNCVDNGTNDLLPPTTSETHSSVDWNFISLELGFTFGFGLFILPLIFYERWRLCYCKYVDELLFRIFPQLDFVHVQRGEHRCRTLRWMT